MNRFHDEQLEDFAEAQQGGGGGCQQEPCSPSSDTPETDEYWGIVMGGALAANEMLIQARKMERERNEARKILDNLDEIMHLMRPRWHQTPSMCGRYPCWIVWLPKEGTCERKTLTEAIIECAAQMIPENETSAGTDASEKTL